MEIVTEVQEDMVVAVDTVEETVMEEFVEVVLRKISITVAVEMVALNKCNNQIGAQLI